MGWLNVRKDELECFLLTLSEKEARLYEMRRVRKNKKKLSFKQIAQVLNLTEEEVKQLVERVQCKILITFIEKPVRKAVDTFFNKDTIGAGFYTGWSKKFNDIEPSWAIVFNNKISPEIKNAAIKAGLKINERYIYHRDFSGYGYLTDVYLPNVSQEETAKAKQVFDKFSDLYIQATED